MNLAHFQVKKSDGTTRVSGSRNESVADLRLSLLPCYRKARNDLPTAGPQLAAVLAATRDTGAPITNQNRALLTGRVVGFATLIRLNQAIGDHERMTMTNWIKKLQHCKKVCVAAGMALLLTTPAHSESGEWRVVQQKNGVAIQQKAVEGSAFAATRGSLVSSANMFDVLAVLKNVEACSDWLHKCKHGEVIAEMSKRERLYYTVIDSPFVLKDRDTYVHSVVSYDPVEPALYIAMTGAEDTAPPAKKRVRVLGFRGYWLLERLNNKQTRLTYKVHMDPQTSSAGMVDSNVAKSVLQTLLGVDRLAQQAPYLNTPVTDDSLAAITGSIDKTLLE